MLSQWLPHARRAAKGLACSLGFCVRRACRSTSLIFCSIGLVARCVIVSRIQTQKMTLPMSSVRGYVRTAEVVRSICVIGLGLAGRIKVCIFCLKSINACVSGPQTGLPDNSRSRGGCRNANKPTINRAVVQQINARRGVRVSVAKMEESTSAATTRKAKAADARKSTNAESTRGWNA